MNIKKKCEQIFQCPGKPTHMHSLVTLTDGADQTRRRGSYEDKSHHHPREVEGGHHVAQQEHFPVSQTLQV